MLSIYSSYSSHPHSLLSLLDVLIFTVYYSPLQTCEISGYRIPEGSGVVYVTGHANRDPSIFAEPDRFRPERWKNE